MPHASDKTDLVDELLAGLELIRANALKAMDRMLTAKLDDPRVVGSLLALVGDADYYLKLAKERLQ